MRSSHNWSKLVIILVIAGLFLVACERPLPGGYNGAEGGAETGAPDAGAYPTESEGIPMSDQAPLEGSGYPGVIEEAPLEAPAEAPAGEAYPADGAPPTAAETPVVEEAPPAEVPAVEEPAPEGSQPETPAAEVPAETPAEPAAEPVADTDATPGTHTVVAGENLYRIGLLYGISWTDLAAANGITDPVSLSVGQVLIIPTGETSAETPPTEDAPEVEEPAVETPGETTLPTTYIVQAGDNLFRIGLNFGVNWTDIVAANGIVNNFIYPGQELIIPAPDGSTAVPAETTEPAPAEESGETPAVTGVTHVVQAGETVFGIAFLYNVPWTSVVSANELPAPYTLEAGQTLVIPES